MKEIKSFFVEKQSIRLFFNNNLVKSVTMTGLGWLNWVNNFSVNILKMFKWKLIVFTFISFHFFKKRSIIFGLSTLHLFLDYDRFFITKFEIELWNNEYVLVKVHHRRNVWSFEQSNIQIIIIEPQMHFPTRYHWFITSDIVFSTIGFAR